MAEDPIRLLDESESRLARTLLSAAREESPRPAALQRTLTAVGVGVTLKAAGGASSAGKVALTASSAKAGAASTAVASAVKAPAAPLALLVTKWLALGAVAGVAASGAVYGVRAALEPSAPSLVSSTSIGVAAPLHAAPRVSTTVESVLTPALSVVSNPAAALPSTHASSASSASSSSSSPSASSAPTKADTSSSLAAEVAILDQARRALAAGDNGRVLQDLNGYETRFSDARMLPEVLYLRLEAFTRQGDLASASSTARQILERYPSSPHAARARAVLGESGAR